MKRKTYIWLQSIKKEDRKPLSEECPTAVKASTFTHSPEPWCRNSKAPTFETWFIPIQHCSKGLSFKRPKSFHHWFQRWTGRIHVRDWISLGWRIGCNLPPVRDSQRLTPLSFGPAPPPPPRPPQCLGNLSWKLVLDSTLSPHFFHPTSYCPLPNLSPIQLLPSGPILIVP